MKHWLIAGALFLGAGLAQSVPLTRYFPDNALATLEFNDLQGAIEKTGQFGEETLSTLSGLLNDSLSDLGKESGMASSLGVRSAVGAFRDASVALYTDSRSSEPLFLAVVRLGQFGVLGRMAQGLFDEELKGKAAKLREGSYVAVNEGDVWVGLQNGLLYFSSNADLLRGYLRRVQGKKLPVLSQGAAYRAVMDDVGPGWFRYYLNFASIAKVVNRLEPLPPKGMAVLRTLNLLGFSQAVTARGVENRSTLVLNPNGGDSALYKLLTHNPESLGLIAQMPANALGSAIISTNTEGWLDYLSNWADVAEPNAKDRQAVKDGLASLKDYLGNEWGVSTSGKLNGLFNPAYFAQLSDLEGLDDTATAEEILKMLGGISFYAQVKDGPKVLEAITDAFLRDQPENTQLENLDVSGNPALKLSKDQVEIFFVAKGNTLVIGNNQRELETALAQPVLSTDAEFSALTLPKPLSGVQFVRPLKLSNEDLAKLVDSYLEMASEGKATISPKLRQTVTNWLESWQSRIQNSYGYMTVKGNRLQTFGLSRFRWNR